MLASLLWMTPGSGSAGDPTLDLCLGTGPPPSYPGHRFVLDTFPGQGPMHWIAAYPNLRFDRPTQLTVPPDGTRRRFVVEQTGAIRVFPADRDASSSKVFLDLSDEVVAISDSGLLGMAFSPDYSESGHFYVHYVAEAPFCDSYSLCSRVVRYTTGDDPDIADPESALLLLEFEQDDHLHSGGAILFGPDGLLYVATGDGTGNNSKRITAQDLTTLLGGILRIDPRARDPGGRPYSIPPDNPLAGNTDGNREELWAWGLRNPWRISFDRLTGDLWIGDVGHSSIEEVNFVPASQIRDGGINFGWPYCEGTQDSDTHVCSDIESTPPRFEYNHRDGTAVIGGYVYRGSRLADLYGTYVFADYGRDTRRYEAGQMGLVADNVQNLASLAEDEDGELYAVKIDDGRVLELEPAPNADVNVPDTLRIAGVFEDVSTLEPKPGMIEYQVRAPLWSDGAIKRRWIALPEGGQIGVDSSGNWTFPVGTVLVKHFELRLAGDVLRRLETRVLVRLVEGWLARTYRWNAEETNAALVSETQTEILEVDGPDGVEQRTWTYPGPTECMGCHTIAQGRILGVRARQLDREVACEDTHENQLDAWGAAGLLSPEVQAEGYRVPYVDTADESLPAGPRARSYMASNCSMCHQPLGPAPGGLDLRFDTPVSEMSLIDVPPVAGDLGVPDPLRVRPGSAETSILWHRMATDDVWLRMARGTTIPDPVAVELFADWIDEALPVDGDADGVDDQDDNCTLLANRFQVDTDGDDFGNPCDCDFDNDLICNWADRALLNADLSAGLDAGFGTDMDASGVVDLADVALFERGRARGEPGPAPEPTGLFQLSTALLALAVLRRSRTGQRLYQPVLQGAARPRAPSSFRAGIDGSASPPW